MMNSYNDSKVSLQNIKLLSGFKIIKVNISFLENLPYLKNSFLNCQTKFKRF